MSVTLKSLSLSFFFICSIAAERAFAQVDDSGAGWVDQYSTNWRNAFDVPVGMRSKQIWFFDNQIWSWWYENLTLVSVDFITSDPAFSIGYQGCFPNIYLYPPGAYRGCGVAIYFTPSDTEKHCATFNFRVEYDYFGTHGHRDSFNTVCGTGIASQNLQLNISQLRVAQRVFEPSASGGSTIDIVTKKPFAVEVVLSGTIPDTAKELKASLSLFVDDVLKKVSDPIRIGDIAGSNSKVFLFSEVATPGAKNIKVVLAPISPLAGIFDSSHIQSKTRVINVHETKLALHLVNLTACVSLVATCFDAPSDDARTLIATSSFNFAQDVLPVSQGGLTYSRGPNLTSSQPGLLNGKLSSILRDAFEVWIKKKAAFSDVGVATVSSNYFQTHDPTLAGVVGFKLSGQSGVVFVDPQHSSTLAHEIYHVLGVNFSVAVDPGAGHSSEEHVEGVGKDESQIWTTGNSLIYPVAILSPDAYNVMYWRYDWSVPSERYNVDRGSYNAALKTILSGKVDPKVILIGGVLDSNNKLTSVTMLQAEANLDPQVDSPNLLIEGLDSTGKSIASVRTRLNSEVEFLLRTGESLVQNSGVSFFTATLPDNGTIARIRAINDGQILFSRSVKPLKLKDLVSGLSASAFAGSQNQARAYVQLVQNEYRKFLDSKNKGKVKQAGMSLQRIEEILVVNLKSDFDLVNGDAVFRYEAIQVIEDELRGL